MKRLSFFRSFFSGLAFFLGIFLIAPAADAVTCSITTSEVINQAYVTSNSCTAIEINGNVSTTWIGTVDLSGGTVTVKDGFTMTMGSSSEMILGAGDDFIVETNATATHLLEDKNGLKITARNITVYGDLSAAEKGCRRSGPSGDNGYGVDITTGECGYQTGGYGRGGGGSGSGGGGGSHAGSGGGGGSSAPGGSFVYGSSLFPSLLGSGGGTGYYGTAFGGAGGGVIHVTSTGTLHVTGRILANGGTGNPTDFAYNGGGGGAGGSIRIQAAILSGTGLVSANGGAGSPGGGGGSGGRVAVQYGALSGFTLSNITANRGLGGVGGGWGNGVNGLAGTSHILDRVIDDGAGTLTITSGHDFNTSGDYTRDVITVASDAWLSCATSTALTISSVATLTLSNVTWSCSLPMTAVALSSATGIETVSTTISFTSATSLSITAPTWTNVTTTITNTKSGSWASFAIDSDLTLRDFTYTGGGQGAIGSSGGMLSFTQAYALSMVSSTIYAGVTSTQMTALTIDSRSSIDASRKGCRGSLTTEDGFGPDETTGVCAISTSGFGRAGNGGGGGGGGAAHAGTGGASSGGGAAQLSTYGSSTQPILPGSGGGGGYWQAPAAGGDGGGRVFLSVSGVVTIDGSVKADGGTGLYSGSYNAGGGGSGGSIYIRAGTFAGGGSVTANGGSSQTTGGGGGGGGRIAILYSSLSFSGTSSSALGAGGTGAGSGSVGSIYTLQLNVAPDVPSSLGPSTLVNGSTTGTGTPTLSFTLSDPDVADTVKYRVQIDDSSDFGSPLVDYTSALAAQGSSLFQVGQSAGSGAYNITSSSTLPNGSFYWRVKTIDQNTVESSYVAANSGSVAFLVDSTARLLSFQSETASGLESLTSTSVRILLNTTHFENVTVNYAVTGETATGSGTDYTLASGTATITAGQTSTTVSFTVIDDLIDEPDETFTLTLSSPAFAVIGSNTSTIYTITDNDTAAITITPTSTSLTEGQASSYSLVLTTPPTSTVQVLISPETGLVLSASTLTFTTSDWSTPQTIYATSTNDTIVTGNRTLTITHTPSTTAHGYHSLSLSSVTLSVQEDDVGGGGSGGGSAASGSPATSIGTLVPLATVIPITPSPSTPIAPILIPSPSPDIPAQIVTILNPSDVVSLVEATQSSRDFVNEGRSLGDIRADARVFRVTLDETSALILSNFVTYGISERTRALGSGERRALIRDALETMRTANINPADLERLTRGMIPAYRNLAEERRQLPRVRATFRAIYGHDPNFQNTEENLAWNTLMYRIRFPRDLSAERGGITEFRTLFGRAPQDPFQWATVRVLGYVE